MSFHEPMTNHSSKAKTAMSLALLDGFSDELEKIAFAGTKLPGPPKISGTNKIQPTTAGPVAAGASQAPKVNATSNVTPKITMVPPVAKETSAKSITPAPVN